MLKKVLFHFHLLFIISLLTASLNQPISRHTISFTISGRIVSPVSPIDQETSLLSSLHSKHNTQSLFFLFSNFKHLSGQPKGQRISQPASLLSYQPMHQMFLVSAFPTQRTDSHPNQGSLAMRGMLSCLSLPLIDRRPAA